MNLVEAIANQKTQHLCVSLSSNPGTFGTRVHNAGYKALGLDYEYVACKCDDIIHDIALVKKHNVRGASISMPFKQTVMPLLVSIDISARSVGAVNTVANLNGHTIGYNTDVFGFKALAAFAKLKKDEKICVHGSGGVARAVLEALIKFPDVTIYARNEAQARLLAAKYSRPCYDLYDDYSGEGVVINCTPVGMNGELIHGVELSRVTKYIDVIVKETPLASAARKMGIPTFTGETMALYQAWLQFSHYTGKQVPIEVLKEALA